LAHIGKKKRYFILCGDGQLKCFDKKPDSPIATKHLKKTIDVRGCFVDAINQSVLHLSTTKGEKFLLESDEVVVPGSSNRETKKSSLPTSPPTDLMEWIKALSSLAKIKEPSIKENLSKQGWLLQRKRVVDEWKRKYFVLEGEILSYFRQKPSAKDKKKGFINLRESTIHWKDTKTLLIVSGSTPDDRYFTGEDAVNDILEWEKLFTSVINNILETVMMMKSDNFGSVVKIGWISKREGSSWKRRFFVLTTFAKIYYFKYPPAKVEDFNEKASLRLVHCTVTYRHNQYDREHCVKFVSTTSQLLLITNENLSFLEEWVRAIDDASKVYTIQSINAPEKLLLVNAEDEEVDDDQIMTAKIIKSGWLKRKEENKKWKRRWCVITDTGSLLYFNFPLTSPKDLEHFGGMIPLYGSYLKLQTVPNAEDELYAIQVGHEEGKFELGIELKMLIIDWFHTLKESLNAALKSKLAKGQMEFSGNLFGVDGNVTLLCRQEGFQFFDGTAVVKDIDWADALMPEEKNDHILIHFKNSRTGQEESLKFYSPRSYEICQIIESQLPEKAPTYLHQAQDQESLAKEGKGNRPKKSLTQTGNELKDYFSEKYQEKVITDDKHDDKQDEEAMSERVTSPPISERGTNDANEEEHDRDSDEEIFKSLKDN